MQTGATQNTGAITGVKEGYHRLLSPQNTVLVRMDHSLHMACAAHPAPAGKSGAHRHAGSVFAYVLSGAIRSENSATRPVKVYHAGESFFEPPGSTHRISENASATEPASLLAIFIADDGAQLTRFDK